MTTKQTQKKGFMARLKTYLLAGVLVTAPAFITLYVVGGIIHIADRWVKSLIPARFYPDMKIFGIPGVGLLLLLILLIAVGFVTASWAGKLLVSFTDRFFTNTPVLSSLYSTLKQLFHTFLGENTTSFRQVVLVEFPHKDCWSIGFVTGNSEEKSIAEDEDILFVFVPTTPNPTSGFLFQTARSKVRNTDMTVEQGLKLVVSMGITK